MKDDVISFDDYKNFKNKRIIIIIIIIISFEGKSYFNLVFY